MKIEIREEKIVFEPESEESYNDNIYIAPMIYKKRYITSIINGVEFTSIHIIDSKRQAVIRKSLFGFMQEENYREVTFGLIKEARKYSENYVRSFMLDFNIVKKSFSYLLNDVSIPIKRDRDRIPVQQTVELIKKVKEPKFIENDDILLTGVDRYNTYLYYMVKSVRFDDVEVEAEEEVEESIANEILYVLGNDEAFDLSSPFGALDALEHYELSCNQRERSKELLVNLQKIYDVIVATPTDDIVELIRKHVEEPEEELGLEDATLESVIDQFKKTIIKG